MWTERFWKRAGERAAKTWFEVLLVCLIAIATGVFSIELNVSAVLALSFGAALVSVLVSMTTSGTVSTDSPSVVE